MHMGWREREKGRIIEQKRLWKSDYYSRGALKGSALSKQRVSAKPTLPNPVRMTRKSVYDQFQACKFVL